MFFYNSRDLEYKIIYVTMLNSLINYTMKMVYTIHQYSRLLHEFIWNKKNIFNFYWKKNVE